MSNLPKSQKYLTYLSWIFAGIMMLGGFIGVINDTLDLITLPVSIVGTVLIVVLYFGAQQYLKRFPWRTEYGRVSRLNIGMILPLVGMAVLLWLPQILQLIPEPCVFPPAIEDEALIIIATFHHTEGVVDVAAHDEIRRTIQQNIDSLNLENVRVEVEPTVIESANRDEATRLGEKYNAALIIWGSDTGVRIEVKFLNLREPNFVTSETTISETERTQLAKPDEFNQFIIEELPSQLAYLSLFALGKAEVNQKNYEQAIFLIVKALDSLPDSSNVSNDELALGETYSLLGLTYQATKQLPQALSYHDRAIALNPEYAAGFNNRGMVHHELGAYGKAIADLEHALYLNPEEEIQALVHNIRREKVRFASRGFHPSAEQFCRNKVPCN